MRCAVLLADAKKTVSRELAETSGYRSTWPA
jgi:hypothetical protein